MWIMWINREKCHKLAVFKVDKAVDRVDNLVDYCSLLWKRHVFEKEGKHAEQFNSRTKK